MESWTVGIRSWGLPAWQISTRAFPAPSYTWVHLGQHQESFCLSVPWAGSRAPEGSALALQVGRLPGTDPANRQEGPGQCSLLVPGLGAQTAQSSRETRAQSPASTGASARGEKLPSYLAL